MSENLATILSRSAKEHGDRTALRLDDTEVSFELLEEGSARVAGMLKEKGLEPGDRVATMLPNVPYFALVYYGVLRMGGVVVPINPMYESGEVAYHVGDSDAKLLFAWHDFSDAAREGAEEAGAEVVLVEQGEFEKMLEGADHDVLDREADDVGVILYTSGTTGDPKGSVLTHGNLQKSTDVAPRWST